jgi:hypothetical protein
MSIRTLIRIVAVCLGLVLASPLAWSVLGPFAALLGVGSLLLTAVYLMVLASGQDATRWQLRYHLPSGPLHDGPSELSPSGRSLDRLEQVLHFLAERTGHLVLEANGQGLFLELSPVYGRYVEAQLPRALPEVKLSRENGSGHEPSPGSFFLLVGEPSRDVLGWATEARGTQVRLHIHQGPHATLIARTDGTRPPGRWIRLPLPLLLRRLWFHLPLWDELSLGTRLSRLLPRTDEVTVYSSRSRLHNLVPPRDYHPDPSTSPSCRVLGESTDGRPLTVGYDNPLFTIGAPSAFLAQQALADLQAGWAVVVVSPHRRVLDRIARETGGTAVHWLDPQCAQRSAHLALMSAGEWGTEDNHTIIEATEAFLADLGVDVALPAVGSFCRQLIRALSSSARHYGQDLAFTDLYAVSQGTQALRAFLLESPSLSCPDGQELLARLGDEAGYVQAVSILSAIRTALEPLAAGALHTLCQPPSLDPGQLLREGGLLLAPMTDTDFPRHDRLLSTMLDLALHRALVSPNHPRLSLHLHDPHLYRDDHGRRWIDVTRQDPRLALLLDVQQPEQYLPREGSQIVFRCSDAPALSLIDDWHLPASVADLTELPASTGVARLPGMVVALKVDYA